MSSTEETESQYQISPEEAREGETCLLNLQANKSVTVYFCIVLANLPVVSIFEVIFE